MAFESRKATETESKAPAYETELKAIVYGLAKRRPLLIGKKATVESAHATLAGMMTQKQVTLRLGYWPDKLAEFLEIRHIPGRLRSVSDAISGRPVLAKREEPESETEQGRRPQPEVGAP